MSKAARIRESARKRKNAACGVPVKTQEYESTLHKGRDIILSAEAKALVEEMREHGFAPPKGLPTVKQFSRFAQFKLTQADAIRADVLREELAIIAANGGVMQHVFQRINKPGLKDTAFAQLAAIATRQLAINPVAAQDTQTTDENQVDEDRLEELGAEICGVSK